VRDSDASLPLAALPQPASQPVATYVPLQPVHDPKLPEEHVRDRVCDSDWQAPVGSADW
jgi:hypothetical protein